MSEHLKESWREFARRYRSDPILAANSGTIIKAFKSGYEAALTQEAGDVEKDFKALLAEKDKRIANWKRVTQCLVLQ